MWSFCPCYKKKAKQNKQKNLSTAADNLNLTNNAPTETILHFTKENIEKPLVLGNKEPSSPIGGYENQVNLKNTQRERAKSKRVSQESLFNLTADFEVKKTSKPKRLAAEKIEMTKDYADEPNNSYSFAQSIYQLTKELNIPESRRKEKEELLLGNFFQTGRKDEENVEMDEKKSLVEETQDQDEKLNQLNRRIGENQGFGFASTLSHLKPRKLKPLTCFSERPKMTQLDKAVLKKEAQFTSKSVRHTDALQPLPQSKSNLKIVSVLTINQTSVQKLSQIQKSKRPKSSLPSQISHGVKKSSKDLSSHNIGDYSIESNIPGRANYDLILNKNLVPNNNMILDDSILEAQGISSQGKMILAESSRIDERSFPPWQKSIHEDVRFYQTQKNNWEDENFQFNLDKMQELYDLKLSIERIKDIPNAKIWDERVRKNLMICQGRSQTHGLVCAIITLLSFQEMEKLRFVDNTLYPQKNDNPFLSSNGKYGIRVFLNGAKRLVEVDDKIVLRSKKQSSEKIPLGARTKDQTDFWVSVMEKAICKLYSSSDMVLYTIPSIECYHLSGWIPEIIRVIDIPNSDHLWQRLYQNAEEDNILISLGIRAYDPNTDKDALEIQKGLYKSPRTDVIFDYTYAVVNLSEVEDLKCMKIRNPMGHTNIKSALFENYDPFTRRRILESLEMNENELNKEGVSVLMWDEIVPVCSNIYLNWSPAVYPYRQTIHSRREIPVMLFDPDSKLWLEDFSLEYFPQVLLKIPPHDEDFEVRIMFERHVDSLKRDNLHSLKYHLFSYKGDRIVYPTEALRSQPWSSREVLSDVFIFEASKETEIYSLVLLSSPLYKKNKNAIKDQVFNYTFEVFSFIEIEVIELPFRKIKQREKIEGRFDEHNTGGNILSPNFLKNPAYMLNVKQKEDIHIRVEGPADSSLMIVVIPTLGKDLEKEPIARIDFHNFVHYNPGFYYEGFSSYKLTLIPDKYIILISNQNYKNGNFRLYVDSLSTQLSYYKADFDTANQFNTFEIKEYQELRSKFKTEVEGEWNEANSKGMFKIQSHDFQNFMKNPGHILQIQKTTNVRFLLQSTTYNKQFNKALEGDLPSDYRLEPPSMSVAIFQILDKFKFNMILEDENYAPTAWGFYSREITLDPCKNGYLVVCCSYEKGYIGQYKLTIFSDNKIESIYDSTKLIKSNFSYTIKGCWSKRTAGGSTSELTFYKNPAYEIVPSADCDVYIEINCMEPHPLCISLFESGGKRVTEFDSENLSQMITNSYMTQDLAFIRSKLKKNKIYLVVPSTSQPSQLGKFELKFESTADLNIAEKKPINYRNKNTYSGTWNSETNRGSFGNLNFMKNPNITFKVLEQTNFRIHLYTAENTVSIAIHLYEINQDHKLQLVKSSGHYQSMRMGCFIEGEIKPNKNGYMFVVSTYDSGKHIEFFVELSTLKINDIEITQLFNFTVDTNSF